MDIPILAFTAKGVKLDKSNIERLMSDIFLIFDGEPTKDILSVILSQILFLFIKSKLTREDALSELNSFKSIIMEIFDEHIKKYPYEKKHQETTIK